MACATSAGSALLRPGSRMIPRAAPKRHWQKHAPFSQMVQRARRAEFTTPQDARSMAGRQASP
eukprot:7740743-Alexandrium_andersonii.AAC.1